MLRPALVLTALACALAPAAASARTVDVPAKFHSKIAGLSARSGAPILFPDRIDLDIGSKTRVYANGSADAKGYGLELAGARRCGANACFLAAFMGEKGARLGFKTNVTLVQGIRAHYQPLSCGGSCSPPWIAWRLNGVRYEIQAKTIKGSRAEFVALANSALAAGGRS